MSTSERLDKIVELIRLAQREARRLAVDLPDGQTLEVLDFAEGRLMAAMNHLSEEAHQLRTRFHD